MTLSRRELLAAGAATVAATAVGRALGPGSAAAAAAAERQLPRPGKSGIDHIVVVVMENRSFDHYLGWVPGADGRQAGLVYRDEHGRPHRTHHLTSRHGCGYHDPSHSYQGGRIQLNHGRCDGFRRGSNDDFAIGYYTEADLPFYGPLVGQATVCDRWFPSVMGATMPNRAYTHAGRTDRMDNHGAKSTMPTVWDRLRHAEVPAGYYFGDVPYLALWGERYTSISHRFDEFLSQAASGTLPAFCYVDPPFHASAELGGADDHPHNDIWRGQSFVSTVVSAMANSPLWSRSLLIITYDEWGGFFDHVRPPRLPDDAPLAGRDRTQTGFRVPAFILSPFARRGHVTHHVFDHASIVKFVAWRFGLPHLSTRARATANLAWALDFAHPDTSVPVLPVVPDPGQHACDDPGLGLDSHSEFWDLIAEYADSPGWRHV